MKVDPALQTYWDRQLKFKEFLKKEFDERQKIIKQAAKLEIELVLYERRVQKLYLIKQAQLGKNIDRLA